MRTMGKSINRELTKNILRDRTCETCQRGNSYSARAGRNSTFCEINTNKPEFDVCSQWKMKWSDRNTKNWRHKLKIAEKRKAKREAKTKAENPVV